MKNIILAIGVMIALVAGLLGGVLADFSDSEEEMGDKLQAGSLDLLVNGTNDPDVLPFVIDGIIPDKWFDITKTVANDGSIDGWLYLHIKNPRCEETDDHGHHPEPEVVAELGGKQGQKIVPGIGITCDFVPHLRTEIRYDGVPVDLRDYDANGDGHIKLNELVSHQILISPLEQSGAVHKVNFTFLLQDVPEEFYGFDIFDVGDPHEIKWNWWPTNAYQGDSVYFDVLFELLQTDYTPPGS